MSKSTSTYGRKTSPLHTVKLAARGLCSIHRTAILSDGDCWECDGPAAGTYEPTLSGRQLADAVRAALVVCDTEEPSFAASVRSAINTARSEGKLTESLLAGFLDALTADDHGPGCDGPNNCLCTDDAEILVVTPPAPAARPNKFAGHCPLCQGWVEAGQGQLVKVGEKWGAQHIEPCPPAKPAATPLPEVADGYYAIESSGDNDLVFYRVTSSDKWGKSVQMLVGGHPDTFVRRASVAGILARIAADAEAGKRFADEFGTCCRCNRTLTDETSRAAGMGPECRSKF